MRQRELRSIGTIVLGLSLVLLLAGCPRMPSSEVRAVDDRPAIVIVGAPEGAELFVDGIRVGSAADYSGESSLRLLPGTHVIEVRHDGVTLLEQSVYLGGAATKTIRLPLQ